ncbi:hypothetical protein KVR01_004674 [Diaporthe batatas]|uniref:uncharacterized protein n=1 Tax=Diaporthe batatas TaxID=748121 RepID=UPI001D045FC1|nr:uncharacterized protein KVR01_004674 [Diaporthe batatas]KAG8166122.1 hypothetical protein KVR01_004674 [Diaporthe batatas]
MQPLYKTLAMTALISLRVLASKVWRSSTKADPKLLHRPYHRPKYCLGSTYNSLDAFTTGLDASINSNVRRDDGTTDRDIDNSASHSDTKEPDPTPTEPAAQHTISTCAITSAPSATAPPPSGPGSDLTWGCPPGTNCSPPRPQPCDAWSDSPADEFTCQAAHCAPARALVLSGAGNGRFPLNEGYFDLDPARFGLGFDIFARPGGALGRRLQQQQQQHSAANLSVLDDNNNNKSHPQKPRDLSNDLIPAACFSPCNSAYLEAQSMGKTPRLCRPGSAFMAYHRGCEDCAGRNAGQTAGLTTGGPGDPDYLAGKFAQFLRYCSVVSGGGGPPSSSAGAGGAEEEKTSSSSSSSRPTASAAEDGGAAGASPRPDSGAAFAEAQQGGKPAGASPPPALPSPPPSSLSSPAVEEEGTSPGTSEAAAADLKAPAQPETPPGAAQAAGSHAVATAGVSSSGNAAATVHGAPSPSPSTGAGISSSSSLGTTTKPTGTGPAAVATAGSPRSVPGPLAGYGTVPFAAFVSFLIV